MKTEKFKSEVTTLSKFFQTYCKDKHTQQKQITIDLKYNQSYFSKELLLCDKCETLIHYSLEKLQECPHYEKPRCRKCPNPCYDKKEWKQLAKIMKYSGIKLGFVQLKEYLKPFFSLKASVK